MTEQSRPRIAVIFDDRPRPETTGVYCRRALSQWGDVTHFHPEELDSLRQQCMDLHLFVDDGLRYPIPLDLPRSAYWAIDTHIDCDWALERGRQVEFLFAAQRDGVEQLRSAGRSAVWLPLACDPEVHRPHALPPRWDICFVGTVVPGPRRRLLELIEREFANTFIGQRYFEQLAQTYSQARIGFNRSVENDVNMRVFETLACGTLLVTNELSDNGQAELFRSDEELVTYSSDAELLDKLHFYLRQDEVRQRIARAGQKAVVERHTYSHRMKTVVDTVFGAANKVARSVSTNRLTPQTEAAASGDGCGISRNSLAPCNHDPAKITVPQDAALTQETEFVALADRANWPDRARESDPPRQDAWYFEFSRPEVAALVPANATRILDIGCGAGSLGAILKARQPVEVTGIECDPVAAARARSRLDLVIEGNVESDGIGFPDNSFDCVVCADILEHLRRPGRLLDKIRRWLRPEGCLIASVPNIRHHTVIAGLLEGNWTYETAGLLDQDHVRFFTRRELEKLLFRHGFAVASLQSVAGPGDDSDQSELAKGLVRVGSLEIGGLSPAAAGEFHAYQFLVVARPEIIRARHQRAAWERLAAKFPWPPDCPDVPLPTDHVGWLAEPARELLRLELRSDTQLVVELGTWLGLSTRYIAELAPQAKVITIDHWRGSPEHQRRAEWSAMLPTLLPTFQRLTWDYRERILPLPMTTTEGLRAIAAAGLRPDVIFVDADHRFDSVFADLSLCQRLFPEARLVGDDFEAEGVHKAVAEVAELAGATVDPVGVGWRAWRMNRRRPQSAPRVEPELTSIILVTFNELAYTQACLDSMRFRTDEPYELIIVDNGSTDGTVEYLRSLAGVIVIENRENRGFPAAANQGIRASRGRNVLLLNNDTIVTTGWLRRMLDVFDRESSVGLVGPCTNRCGGEQQISVGYDRLEGLDGFAWDWGLTHAGQIVEIDRLVGFCLLVRRSVFDVIGLLDERFGIGNFEDDDLCHRAIHAGYRAVIAVDALVHHFGSRTFAGSGVDLRALLEENGRKYQDKWSRGSELGIASDGPPAAAHQNERPIDSQSSTKTSSAVLRPGRFAVRAKGGDGFQLVPKTTTVSACFIVRDNESTIGAALKSIVPYVDELVVVDTGSGDRTPEICQHYGARVFHFPWCDDFSAARNKSLEQARGEWIFWMDSDDTLPAECGRRLRDLVNGHIDPQVLGYVIQVHCPSPSDDGGENVTVVDHVKLIRNRPELRFEGRIHEQLLPAIRRAGGEVAWTDLYVVHSGADHSPAGWQRKLDRDLRILHQELLEKPEHPFVLFNLGMTYADARRYLEAIDYLNRCVAVSRPEESHLRKAFALLVSSLAQAEKLDAAWDACQLGLGIYPDDKELLFRAALLHHRLGRLEAAEKAYLRVLHETTERHFASFDRGLVGYKTHQNLAIVYDDMGRRADATEQWRHVTRLAPEYLPGWRGVGEILVRQSAIAEATALCHDLLERSGALFREGLILRGRIADSLRDDAAAMRDFQEADRLDPTELEPLQSLCRLLFERGHWDQAELNLRRLTERAPQDAAAYHNLGTVQFCRQSLPDAVTSLHRSLALRPASVPTWTQLGRALRESHRATEARDVWRQVLELEPDHPEARAALSAADSLGLAVKMVNDASMQHRG